MSKKWVIKSTIGLTAGGKRLPEYVQSAGIPDKPPEPLYLTDTQEAT